MKDFRNEYGSYALVTGASSGIGEEFSRQLAAARMNLVLVARRKDRLEALAAELTRTHGTVNEVVALDLLHEAAADELWHHVEKRDIGMVVINAGFSIAGEFIAHTRAEETDLFTIHATVPLQLTHRFARRMADQGRGAIVLMSSSIAAGPVPYQANFAAAKAYVLSLGQALHHELKPRGVDVLVVSPGLTQTEGVSSSPGIDFDKLAGGAKMSPTRVVRTALAKLGSRAHVIPGAINNAADLVGKYLLPRRLTVRIYGWMIGRALTEPVTPR